MEAAECFGLAGGSCRTAAASSVDSRRVQPPCAAVCLAEGRTFAAGADGAPVGQGPAASVRGETPGFALAEPGGEEAQGRPGDQGLESPGPRARAGAAAQAIPITQGRAGGRTGPSAGLSSAARRVGPSARDGEAGGAPALATSARVSVMAVGHFPFSRPGRPGGRTVGDAQVRHAPTCLLRTEEARLAAFSRSRPFGRGSTMLTAPSLSRGCASAAPGERNRGGGPRPRTLGEYPEAGAWL